MAKWFKNYLEMVMMMKVCLMINVMHMLYKRQNLNLNHSLNSNITIDDVNKVIRRTKNKKAVGWDNLPNKIMKNDLSVTLLCTLFQTVFSTSCISTIWK